MDSLSSPGTVTSIFIASIDCKSLDRFDARELAGNSSPGISRVIRTVDFAHRGADIDACRVQWVDGHCIAQDGDELRFGGQAFRLSRPGFSSVARAINRKLSVLEITLLI